MKKFCTAFLLIVSLTGVVFGQEAQPKSAPAKPEAKTSDKVPELSSEQKKDLLKLQVKFMSISQQMAKIRKQSESLQQLATDVQKQYTNYVQGLCPETAGKKYTVDMPGGDADPSCKEVPASPKAEKK